MVVGTDSGLTPHRKAFVGALMMSTERAYPLRVRFGSNGDGCEFPFRRLLGLSGSTNAPHTALKA